MCVSYYSETSFDPASIFKNIFYLWIFIPWGFMWIEYIIYISNLHFKSTFLLTIVVAFRFFIDLFGYVRNIILFFTYFNLQKNSKTIRFTPSPSFMNLYCIKNITYLWIIDPEQFIFLRILYREIFSFCVFGSHKITYVNSTPF